MAGYDDFSTPVDAGIRPAAYVDASALGIKPAIPADAKPNPYDAISSPASAPAKTLREKYKEQLAAGKYEDGHNTPDAFTRVTDVIADPFGVRDQVRGGGAYLGKIISGQGSEAANKAYNEEVERARAENEYTRENMTRAGRIGADIVGGFGTTGAGKALATAGSNFLSRAGQSAKAGAQFGFLSGAGHTEGDIVDRLGGGAEGAAWGAALGPALSEVAVPGALALYRGASNAPNAIGNALRTVVPGTRDNIDQRLLQKLRQQNMTPADARTQMQAELDAARFGQTQLNPLTTLADSGPAMQKLAYSVKATPGQASTDAENFLNARAKGSDKVEGYHQSVPVGNQIGPLPQKPDIPSQYDRVSDYTRRSLQVTRDNAARTEDRLTAGQKADSDAAYTAFRNHPGPIPVEDILQANAADIAGKATSTSDIAKAIDDAHSLFTHEGHAIGTVQGPTRTETARSNLAQMALDDKIAKATAAGDTARVSELKDLKQGLSEQFAAKTKDVNLTAPTNELTPAQFDVAKQQLDDKIRAAQRSGDNYKASVLIDLQKKLVKRADEATDGLYAKARGAYATPQGELDALEAGRNFKSEDLDRIKQNYKTLTSPERRAYRGGAASKTVQDLGEKPIGSNVAGYFNNPNMETRMNALAGPKRAEKHAALMDMENRMAETRGKVNFGSRTAENQEANLDFSLMTRLGRQLKQGNILGATGDAVASTVSHIYKYREMDAKLLARDLFEIDPVKRAATLSRLEARYGQQQARQAVNTAHRIAQRALAARTQVPQITNSLMAPSDPKRSNALANGR